MEEDLEEEMNKRLKEKDKEAANELKRKQEELRTLLQIKEREYEVHFHVVFFLRLVDSVRGTKMCAITRKIINFPNVFVKCLDFDDTSYQLYFMDK